MSDQKLFAAGTAAARSQTSTTTSSKVMSSTSNSSSASDSEHSNLGKRKRTQLEDGDTSGSDDNASSNESDPSSDENDETTQSVEDVPVLSHAEQRRQKKKEEKAQNYAQSKDATSSLVDKKPSKVKNSAELAPSKIPKRQNSVWVGNLSFKTTPASLRQFFDGVGEITRIHMPMKLASAGPGGKGTVKENRGFAYVDFATPDAKTVATTLSENHLDGRRLLIKDGDDYSGRPSTSSQGEGEAKKDNLTGHTKTAQKILASQKQPAGPTLFLGNLGFETTTQSIRGLLENHRVQVSTNDTEAEEIDQAGEEKKKDVWIRKIRMGTFEDSGKCKGWAFVDFTSIEHATAALTNPKNHSLDGRKLVVEFASPEAVRRGGGGPRAEKGKERQTRQSEGGAGSQVDRTSGPHRERVRPVRKRQIPGELEEGAVGEDYKEQHAKKRRLDDGEGSTRPSRDWESRAKVRAKPGAALAMAKREDVAIVPSRGKKIVF